MIWNTKKSKFIFNFFLIIFVSFCCIKLLWIDIFICTTVEDIKQYRSAPQYKSEKVRNKIFHENQDNFNAILQLFLDDNRIKKFNRNKIGNHRICKESSIEYSYIISDTICLTTYRAIDNKNQKRLSNKELKHIKEVFTKNQKILNMDNIYREDEEIIFNLLSNANVKVQYAYCLSKDNCKDNKKYNFEDKIGILKNNPINDFWYSKFYIDTST